MLMENNELGKVGLGVLLYPAEMQGLSLVVMQHLHLVVGEAEEVAEVKQEYQQGVEFNNKKSFHYHAWGYRRGILDEGFPTRKTNKARGAYDSEANGKQQ